MAKSSVANSDMQYVFNPEPKFTSLEEVMSQIDVYVKYFQSLKSYEDREVANVLRALLNIFYGWHNDRVGIAQRLVEQCFPKEIKAMTDYFLSAKEKLFTEEGINNLIAYYFSISLVWNFTDASANFSKAIVLVDLIPQYLTNLSEQPDIAVKFKGAVAHIVRGSLGIFHNIVSNCPEYKQHFREKKVNEVVEPYMSHQDEEMKCVAIMIMSSLINEDEADKLEDSGSIKFMLALIRKALSSENHKATASRGSFSALELLKDLVRIAVNDKNKRTIVDEKALPLLVEAMKSENEEEQEYGAKIIWSLCFDQYSKQKVKEEANCINTLETLSKSANAKVKKSAMGALWEIRGEEMHQQPQATAEENEKHIFISYDWGHAKIVRKIYEKLKSDGHKVWIDIDKMGGSTLEAMAGAVENAKVVLICLSERYKLSPSCRSEAKYTWKRRRPIVPLMMQRKYEPDGWLGIIIEDAFYIDFAKYEFDEAYKMLLEQMAPYISNMAEIADDIDGKLVVPDVAPPLKAAPKLPPSDLVSTAAVSESTLKNSYKAAKWNKEQVQQWVTSSLLRDVLNPNLKGLLDSMDGELLVALCWVKNKVPDYFMNHLSQQYNADILQMLHLIKALNQLP